MDSNEMLIHNSYTHNYLRRRKRIRRSVWRLQWSERVGFNEGTGLTWNEITLKQLEANSLTHAEPIYMDSDIEFTEVVKVGPGTPFVKAYVPPSQD